jgi:cysteine dioxygenase
LSISSSFIKFSAFHRFKGEPQHQSNVKDLLSIEITAMAPVKTGLSRALRSKVSNGVPRIWSGVNRGIAATAKDANSMNSYTPTTTSNTSIPFSTPAPHSRLPPPTTFPAQSPPNSTAFEHLLNQLTRTLTTTTYPSLPQLHNLMRAYTSDSTHWSKFAHQNPHKQYTRNLVCEVPGVFNLLVLVWTPGKRSPVHDHADAHCLMKVLQGSLQETRYSIPTNPGTQGPLVIQS